MSETTENVTTLKKMGRSKPVAVYVGAQDFLYEQGRRRPSAERPYAPSVKSIKAAVADLKPSALKDKVTHRSQAARDLPSTFATRGAAIVGDWTSL